MKNRIIFIAGLCIIILLCIIRFYVINRTYSQVYFDKMNNSSNEDNNVKMIDVTSKGVGMVLVYAIEEDLGWDNLPLTGEFISKYKNGKGIMPERDIYSMFNIGRDVDGEGNTYIVIFAEHKSDFFDFTKNNSKTTVYYYNYTLSNDNKLDDIELKLKKTIDSTTGEEIK